MRLTALSRIAQMNEEEVFARLESLPEYNDLPDGGAAVREYWQEFLNKPQAEVLIADDLTEDERKQFIIKDNVNFGDWDYDELENWDADKLEGWGVDMSLPDFGEGDGNWGGSDGGGRTITETEKQPKNGNRLHHKINYRYLMPKLLKGDGSVDNIPWDTYPEDVPFTNEPKRKKPIFNASER